MWTKMLCLPAIAAIAIGASGCGASASYAESYDYYDDGGYMVESESYRGEQSRSRSATVDVVYDMNDAELAGALVQADGATFAEPAPVQGEVAPPVNGTAPEPPADEEELEAGPLLIYNGSVTLAVYHVEENQEAAIAIVETFGGYASYRETYSVEFRVPAEHFRAVLEELGTLGDVLDTQWSAQDVTEQYRDVEIRLRNALQMRERLEALLLEAQTVQDALAIEAQLERVTLTIEQMRGQLRFLQDRIAYSTITLYFSQIFVNDVPGEEYRLPFPWLNTLGVEYLLSL